MNLYLPSFLDADYPLNARKKRSKNHFCWDLVVNEDGVTKCIICKKTILSPGVTNIAVHYRHHNEAWNKRKEEWELEQKKLKTIEEKVGKLFLALFS